MGILWQFLAKLNGVLGGWSREVDTDVAWPKLFWGKQSTGAMTMTMILLLQLITCQSDPSQAIEKGIPSATSICSCQGWVRQQHASRGLRGTQSCGNAVWLWLCHQLPKFQDKRAPWVVSIDDRRKEAMNHYFCPEQWTPKMFGHQRPKTLFVAVFIRFCWDHKITHITTIYHNMPV